MHVTFVPLTGFRIREEELQELGMTLPGLAVRAKAIGQLPALGLQPQRLTGSDGPLVPNQLAQRGGQPRRNCFEPANSRGG